ncbi:MAG: LysM peptidoglycan-binding domain-containing protein [Alphaproteobacteria bacterium]|nr:MAG: LysM peptidoglycan-binding domain-containing protein [Alphaproteobacteria bacterium]
MPSFDIVRLSRGGTGVIAGRARAGWRVIVLADGKPVAQTVADGRGQWVVILEEALAPGSRELTLQATNDAGEMLESRDLVVASIPEGAGAGAGGEEGVVAMMTPKTGGPSRLLQRPPAPAAANGGVLSIDAVDLLPNGAMALSGSGTAGGATRLYIDDRFVGEARSDAQGYWLLVVDNPPPVRDAPLRLRADHVLAEGKVELRVEQMLEPGEMPVLSAGTQKVVVQPGNNLWTFARMVYGKGIQYSLIFQANTNQIRDPDLIYPGQVFVLPTDSGTAP